EVAGGGGAGRLVAVGPRPGDGDRDHPVLERVGRVHAVVLEVEVPEPELGTQPVRLDQGREALTEGGYGRIVLDREQVAVAPHARGAGLDALPADHTADGRVVVDDVQRPETGITNMVGLDLVLRATLTAAQAQTPGSPRSP